MTTRISQGLLLSKPYQNSWIVRHTIRKSYRIHCTARIEKHHPALTSVIRHHQTNSASLKDVQSISQLKIPRPHPSVDKVIRVDHAGEFGADRIYAGQAAVLGQSEVGDIIKVNRSTTKEYIAPSLSIVRSSSVV